MFVKVAIVRSRSAINGQMVILVGAVVMAEIVTRHFATRAVKEIKAVVLVMVAISF